jgi:DNA (cytosine-5)-methyltransferase 1
MKFLSVCSGIEAASVAWNPLGWKAVAFSEIEPFPCAVLAHHYPDTPNWGDMTKYQDWPDADVDLLCGGTPCQSFSIAGLRGGLDDARGNLMLTYAAIARKYRPRWLVWENVPGVLSSDGGRDFGSLLGLLSGRAVVVPAGGWKSSGVVPGIARGYGLAWRVLDAQHFGLAQRRKRVFVVGCLGDWRRAAAVLFERHSLSGHPAPSRKAREGASANSARSLAIRGRDGTPQAELGDDKANALVTPSGGRGGIGIGAILAGIPERERALTASNQRIDAESETLIPIDMRQASRGATMTNNRADGSSGGAPGTGIGEDGDPAPTLSASHTPAIAFDCTASGMNGFGVAEDVSTQLRVGTKGSGTAHAAVAIGADCFNQSLTGDIAATMGTRGSAETASGPTLLQGMQVRRLTPRECERLQGFHDDYTLIPYRGKPAADGPRYKALGNSWAIPCVRWIGERIEAVEAIKDERLAA